MKTALSSVLRKSSLGAQLIAMILLISIIAISISAAVLFMNESKHARSALTEELTALARLIGSRSSAALTFLDNRTATENLNSFSDLDQIGSACLFNERGELFAQYRRPGAKLEDCALRVPSEQNFALFDGETAHVQVPVLSNNEFIGAMQINSTRTPLIKRYSEQILSLALALGGAIAAAIFLAIRLQKLISEPLAKVRDVANAIVASKNYSLRAPEYGKHEIGELASAFNSMLGTIENQNAILAERESYSNQLFYASPIPQLILDPESLRYIDCNQAAANIHGYARREDLIGKSTLDVAAPRQYDGRLASDILAERHDNAQIGLTEFKEFQYRRLDGTLWDGLVTYMVFYRNNLKFLHVCVEDITFRKQAEARLRQLNDELEERVISRTKDLADANITLQKAHTDLKHAQNELIQREKMASLGVLIAGVSHELNTPLGNSLTVGSHMLDELVAIETEVEIGKLTKSRLKDFHQKIHTGLDILLRNLARAIDQVAHFKQVSVDQASDQRRRFDLNKTILDNVSILAPQFKRTRHKIDVAIPDEIIMDSYPGAIGQIITNLVLNSLVHGFTDEMDGVISILATVGDDQRVLLVVTDNGKGISKQNLPRVFDPFFTTRMGQGGSGLGLNIVFNMVSSTLGGNIQVSSTEGVQTRFTISMPLVAP